MCIKDGKHGNDPEKLSSTAFTIIRLLEPENIGTHQIRGL